MISGDKLFNILCISVASNWRLLSWIATDLSLESSSNDEKCSLFLMLYHQVYYDSSVCYELSRLVDNMQIVTNAFIIIISLFSGV